MLPALAWQEPPHPGLASQLPSECVPLGKEGTVEAHLLHSQDALESNVDRTQKMVTVMVKTNLGRENGTIDQNILHLTQEMLWALL